MDKIHGGKCISRRNQVKVLTDYKKYRANLREDFHYMCGYCGKLETVTKNGFEIDHFVPKRVDKSKENDYNNLVYSCKTCNRKKSGDWPTEDSNISHNGVVGYIDPASSDYDKHLCRDLDGNIIWITKVGEYMFRKLGFDMRPIKEVYLLISIKRKMESMEELLLARKYEKQELSERFNDYVQLKKEVDKLLDYMFDNDE